MDANDTLRELLRRAKPAHYAGECDHCGIDSLPAETCPFLAFIAEIDAALDARPSPPQEVETLAREYVASQITTTDEWCNECVCGLDPDLPNRRHNGDCFAKRFQDALSRVPPPQGAPEASVEALLHRWLVDGATDNETPLDAYGSEVVRDVLAALQRARETGAKP